MTRLLLFVSLAPVAGCLLTMDPPQIATDTDEIVCHPSVDCGAYACVAWDGGCLTECIDDEDCATGYECCNYPGTDCYEGGLDWQCIN